MDIFLFCLILDRWNEFNDLSLVFRFLSIHLVSELFTVINVLGGWEKCWEQGLTPWDLGQPTPALLHLHRTGSLPKGRTLVPGCGSVKF